MFNIPNILTISRVIMVPVIVALYYTPYQWLCPWLFILACITDWLDGYMARKMKVVSSFGVFLDPVADKLLVVSVLILLIKEHPMDIMLPGMLIILREVVISALREWAAKDNKKIPVSYTGKLKTAVQMVAIVLLLFGYNQFVDQLGYIGLWIAVVLAWLSLLNYIKSVQSSLTFERKKQ